MPNDVPSVTQGSPLYRLWSLRFIDADGALRSVPIEMKAAPTDAEINAMLNAVGAGSNASAYALVVEDYYGAEPLQSNATNAVHVSTKDAINMLYKDLANRKSQTLYVPSPKDVMFVADTDTPDPQTTELAAIITAMNAVLPATQNLISLRFSQRSKLNERVRV